jgi:hypothetical protein
MRVGGDKDDSLYAAIVAFQERLRCTPIEQIIDEVVRSYNKHADSPIVDRPLIWDWRHLMCISQIVHCGSHSSDLLLEFAGETLQIALKAVPRAIAAEEALKSVVAALQEENNLCVWCPEHEVAAADPPNYRAWSCKRNHPRDPSHIEECFADAMLAEARTKVLREKR